MVSDRALRYQVALGGRALALEGQADTILGFVGGRASDGASFWMKRMDQGLDEVRPEDLLRIDYEGRVAEGEGRAHSEWPFFAELFRSRPRVGAAVHTHPPYSLALASLGRGIEPFDQFGTYFFAAGVPFFEGTPERVYSFDLARAIVDRLADKPALIIPYHGILTVGGSVMEACMRAIFLEKAAKNQLLAYRGGEARPLEEGLARRLAANAPYDLLYRFSWEYYERRVKALDPKFR